MSGELMTHSRRRFERLYDLSERIVPSQYDWVATEDEADAYFALRAFQELNIASLREWRAWFMLNIKRKVSFEEAQARLDALLSVGKIVNITLQDHPKNPRYGVRRRFIPP